MAILNSNQYALLMNPAIAGSLAGFVHHVLVQYPYQRTLFTTAYSIAATEITYCVLLCLVGDGLASVRVIDLIVIVTYFNSIYVLSPESFSKSLSASSSSHIENHLQCLF
jgi:hypothetical protein